MEVNIFRNLNSAKVYNTSLAKIVKMIRTSLLLQELTVKARNYYSNGSKRKGDHIKKHELPAFAPAAYLLGGKGRVNLISLTGICFIDIDHVGEEVVDRCMAILSKEKHILMVSTSISGKGLHILVPYTIRRDDPYASIPGDPAKLNKLYGRIFSSISNRYGQILGVPIDKSTMNAERLCLVSYDAKVIFNPNALPIEYRYQDQRP